MIEETKIQVALAVNSAHVTLMVSRSDGDGVPSRVHWDLHKIEREGFLALCQMVGDAVVRMLAGAHPGEFAKYPLLVPPQPSPRDELQDILLSLMHRSLKEKTLDYAPAIEALFKRHAEDISNTSFVENWESYRLRIDHYNKSPQ